MGASRPASPMDVLPTRISQYEIRRVLGQGGMGTVYLAVDPALQRPVALKVLRTDGHELRERFRREARLIARLQHPNIVAIYAVGEHEEQPFLAMEYIEGEPLSEGIRRRAPWGLQRKLLMAADICAGLAFAHRAGVVHRDVKPSNLMVSNGSGVVRLLDFGIARGEDAAATHGLTMLGNIVGTMNYMSPEQITGQPVDHRSDIFAVGLVLYELLSYCQAFPGSNLATLTYRIVHGHAEPLEELEPTLDPELCAVVARAMARAPEDRYPHLEAMRTDLMRIASRLSPTEAAAMAREGDDAPRTDTPYAAPIWSRALDPTIDSAGPVTPASTSPLRPDAPPLPAPPLTRPRWVVPVAGAGALLGAVTALWMGTRAPVADPPASDAPPVVVRESPPPAEPTGAGRDAGEPPREAPRAPADTADNGAAGPETAANVTRDARATPPVVVTRRDPPQRDSSVAVTPPETLTPRPPSGDTRSATEAPITTRTPGQEASGGELATRAGEVSGAPARVESPPSVVVPTGPSDADQVQTVIARWSRAYAARDARGVDAVMPGAEATYARQFSGLRSASSTLAGCQTSIDGARATATCTEQFAFELTVGGSNRGTRQRRFVLEKRDGDWRITTTSVAQ